MTIGKLLNHANDYPPMGGTDGDPVILSAAKKKTGEWIAEHKDDCECTSVYLVMRTHYEAQTRDGKVLESRLLSDINMVRCESCLSLAKWRKTK